MDNTIDAFEGGLFIMVRSQHNGLKVMCLVCVIIGTWQVFDVVGIDLNLHVVFIASTIWFTSNIF